jgi:uncharacterized membrane protein
MAGGWRSRLELWRDAGVVDSATVERIVEYERSAGRALRSQWPVILILILGALLTGAGVLLFVSASWDLLPPFWRIALLAVLIAAFHGAGAWLAGRSEALSSALHTLGTVSLGAGIALTGQIFNMAEQWPSAILLWAAGALAGYLLLRNWPQLTLLAVLAPMWIASEWLTRYPLQGRRPAFPFLLLLALVYLSAPRAGLSSSGRRALCGLGAIAVLPLGFGAAVFLLEDRTSAPATDLLTRMEWLLAFLLPLSVALLLRGRDAWISAVAAFWVALLSVAAMWHSNLLVHALCAIGSAGLIVWGLHESRGERVNLGVAGFAVTVLSFYFSTVMDKLARSASLFGLGMLVLAGGWFLERVRRKWIARIQENRP